MHYFSYFIHRISRPIISLSLLWFVLLIPTQSLAAASSLTVKPIKIQNNSLTVSYTVTFDPTDRAKSSQLPYVVFFYRADNQILRQPQIIQTLTILKNQDTALSKLDLPLPDLSAYTQVDLLASLALNAADNHNYSLAPLVQQAIKPSTLLAQANDPNQPGGGIIAAPSNDPVQKTTESGSVAFEPKLGFDDVRNALPLPRADFIQVLFGFFGYLWAVIFLLGIIISGIMFIVAGGDPEKAKKAKTYLTWLIISLVIFILAYWAFSLIRAFLVDLIYSSS